MRVMQMHFNSSLMLVNNIAFLEAEKHICVDTDDRFIVSHGGNYKMEATSLHKEMQ